MPLQHLAATPPPPPVATVPPATATAGLPPPPVATVPPAPATAGPPPPPVATVPPAPATAGLPPPPVATVPPAPATAGLPPPPVATVPPATAGPPPPREVAADLQSGCLSHTLPAVSQVCVLPSQYLPPGFQTAGGANPPSGLLSEEQKNQLKQAAYRELEAAAGDRRREPEEAVKELVGRLFFLCRCDVATMLTNVAVSVQSLGRYDVGLLANEDGTAFTFLQSPHYHMASSAEEPRDPLRHRRAIDEAKEKINRADCRSRERFLSFVNSGGQTKCERNRRQRSSKPTKKPEASTRASVEFTKSTYEQMQEVLHQRRTAEKHEKKRGTSAPRSGQAHRSPFREGYLLWRYGGKYPKECYYKNYRLHERENCRQ